MTGTDYNEIINDRNRPTATIRPKGQPDRSHIAGANQPRLKMRTGNGDDAHLWPCRRFVDMPANETELYNTKIRKRNALLKKQAADARLNAEREETKKQIVSLSIVFGEVK